MLCEQCTKNGNTDWNQSVSDEQFHKEMCFGNDEISIDNIDFDSVDPRNIVDAFLGEAFARD